MLEAVESGRDLTPAAVIVLNGLVEDNAAAYQRSREDTWTGTWSALPETAEASRVLQVVTRLANAVAEDRGAAVRRGLGTCRLTAAPSRPSCGCGTWHGRC